MNTEIADGGKGNKCLTGTAIVYGEEVTRRRWQRLRLAAAVAKIALDGSGGSGGGSRIGT